MKARLLSNIVVLGLVALFGTAAANAQQPSCSTANIPFAFTAGVKTLPEGGYTICPVDSSRGVWSVTSKDRRVVAFVVPAEVDSYSQHSKFAFLFHRYGQNYFLAGLQLPEVNISLITTRAEKDLRRTIANQERRPEKLSPTVVAISSSRSGRNR